MSSAQSLHSAPESKANILISTALWAAPPLGYLLARGCEGVLTYCRCVRPIQLPLRLRKSLFGNDKSHLQEDVIFGCACLL